MTLVIQPERKLHGAHGRPTAAVAMNAVIRPDLVQPLRERKLAFVRNAIESALILCGGNRSLAADRLQITRTEIQKWVQVFRREDRFSDVSNHPCSAHGSGEVNRTPQSRQ